MNYSKNVQLVLDILKNEVDGDIKAALTKMTDDYSMTWMYLGKEGTFPTTGKNIEAEMQETYPIQGRKYDIRNIAESGNIVMVEMIESYPDPQTGKIYKTPEVIVLEIKEGKIRTGRHYCDQRISYLSLSDKQIETGLRGTSSKLVIW